MPNAKTYYILNKKRVKFIEKLIRKFINTKQKNESFVALQRNESCFCSSGKKYKNCHAPKIESENKIAYKVIDNDTGEISIKVIKKKSAKIESNLKWSDIGVGSNDRIEK